MNNEKYYQDIKHFPKQFKEGFELARNLKLEGKFDRVVLCGMGGSSLYVGLINDYLAQDPRVKLRIEVVKGYDLPSSTDSNTLFFMVSHSGDTEETISCLNQAKAVGFKYVVVTSGGKLLQLAKETNNLYCQVPTGIQPRLSTGYFISIVIKILINSGMLPDTEEEIMEAADQIHIENEDHAKEYAKRIVGKVPVVYATENNSSLAHISKIKFNENSKTQAFWNFFPELNHNEMIGFSKLQMKPIFLIYQSQFTNDRNIKRIEVFSKLMQAEGLEVITIPLIGDTVLEEILNAYFFIDHVTYYLALEYGVDPEAVEMVENFKKMLG
jgi:glucose/mannose-6-phosphate isomerase